METEVSLLRNLLLPLSGFEAFCNKYVLFVIIW